MVPVSLVTLVPFFLCWGSFLSMLSHRLIHDISLRGRSQCVHCTSIIAWYDLIPVLSWFILKGSCRTCHNTISPLYPFIELLTVLLFSSLFLYIPSLYWFSYTIFFSALIITIRSDLEYMLISRLTTLFLVPLGIVLSTTKLLPLSPLEAASGALIGYGFLWLIATVFTYSTGKEGMGQGDLDLLSFIGAFLGPIGCWCALLVGSIVGSLASLCYLAVWRPSGSIKIPFGPFLAAGALIFVFFKAPLLLFLLGSYS